MARKTQPVAAPPLGSRVVVPVLAATGGGGRSTAAGLIALSFAAAGPAAVVLDTAPRLSSPWPSWAARPGAGLAAVPADRPVTRGQVQQAASWIPGPGQGAGCQVLTDHQVWSAPSLPLPEDPAAWYQLAAVGGWNAVIADTAYPVAHDIVDSRCSGRAGLTTRWCALPFAVPVLCAAASAPGVQALQNAVSAASAEGLPLGRTVVALVQGEGRLPAQARAAATMLEPLVSSVVTVPYDSQLAGHGLAPPQGLRPRAADAGRALAQAVLTAAHGAWGDPLPAAPVPAPAPPPAFAYPPVVEEVPS